MNHGLVLLLFGDLGSGKTAFAQGLARGLDVPDPSPLPAPPIPWSTNTPAGCLFIMWISTDCRTPVDPDEIGLMDLFEENAIVAVEWAQRLHPSDHAPRRLDLFFSVTGDTTRSIRIIAYGLDHRIC
jgi:tRNA threonylcarbamoyladenosine biosynthesis protein TsaE